MTKKVHTPDLPARDNEVGYVYMGTWNDGRLGWSCAPHITTVDRSEAQARRYAMKPPDDRWYSRGRPHYLCRVKIELVRDSRGRPIVRYPGGKPKKEGGVR